MQPITGVVQHYAWGDHAFIPRLLGVGPTAAVGRAVARHPSQRSGHAADGRPLADVTGPLPYLLKVLAAAEPLSLQAHPTAEQARAGFAAGRYPDPEPKPELLCALTPFEAFCGVRPVDATLDLLDELGADELAADARRARRRRGAGRPVPRAAARRPDRRRGVAAVTGPRPCGCAASPSATPATPAWRDAAAQPRPARAPARRSSSARATSTPTSGAPASS